MPKRRLLLLCGVCLGVAISALLFTQPNLQLYVKNLLLEFGLTGFFLFSVVFNTLVIPFPYDPFILAMLWAGKNALAVFVTALGATVLASILAYLFGRHFAQYTKRWFEGATSQKLLYKLEQRGVVLVAASAIIPMPLSLLVWLCGLLNKRLWVVLLVILVTRGARIAAVVSFLN